MPAGLLRTRVQKQIFSGFLLLAAGVVVLMMAFPSLGMNRKLLGNLRAGTAKHHEIHLHWNAPGNSPDPIAGYNVYRSSDGGSTFARLNSSPDVRPDYNDTTVANGTTYIYMVKSVDKNGTESGPSNQILLTVP